MPREELPMRTTELPTTESHRRGDLFEPQDEAHELYTREPGPARLSTQFLPAHGGFRREQPMMSRIGHGITGAEDGLKQADRSVLANSAPPKVVVSADL